MKKVLLFIFFSLFFFLSTASSAHAEGLLIGNDTIDKPWVDAFSNFVVIDTTQPANANGGLTQFEYYARNTNPFRFVLFDIDQANWSYMVKWMSNEIVPFSVGVNIWNPTSPVLVEEGWVMGLYFPQTGTIPFEYVLGGPATYWTRNDSGLPVVGQNLNDGRIEGWGIQSRKYAFIATDFFDMTDSYVCATMNDGTITDSNGNVLMTGYDEYGYNYQAHMFNGFVGNVSRPATPVTDGENLLMQWDDSWLSNVDCNGDNRLDRGLVDGRLTDGISKGTLTNHLKGIVDGKKKNSFIKIEWVGQGGVLEGGQYTIVQNVGVDLGDLSTLFSRLYKPTY